MSEGTFREVKDILSTKRGATDEQRKEEPKWIKVKNLIFPPAIYPDFPDPETPCKSVPYASPLRLSHAQNLLLKSRLRLNNL